MRRLLYLFLGLVLIILSFNMEAQRPKHDYNLIFGGKDMGGGLISFSEQEDTVTFIPIPGEEFQCNLSTNTISMSDVNGQFIFYSEGCRIYTADHEIMKGSEDLKIADRAMWDLWCETQDYRIHHKNIVAFPMMQEGHEHKYHLIYYKARIAKEGRLKKDSLFWAYIDMDANGGEGEIKSRNTFVDTGDFSSSSSEFVRAENGENWWLIQSLLETDSIRIYKIDAQGVTLHREYHIGYWSEVPAYTEMYNRSDASMDGDLYVRLSYPTRLDSFSGFEFYHFDNLKGELSTERFLRLPLYGSETFRSIFIPPDSSRYVYLARSAGGEKFELLNWDQGRKLDTIYSSIINFPILPWDKYEYQNSPPSNSIIRGPDCRYYAPSFVPDNKILIFEEQIPRVRNVYQFMRNRLNSIYELPFNHNFQAPYMPEFLTGTPYETHCTEQVLNLTPTERENLKGPDGLPIKLKYREVSQEIRLE